MAKKPPLPKATLSKDKKADVWVLTEDKTKKVLKEFDTKADATKGGALAKALGADGGSVKIKKEDGKIQEERTFPGDRDPSSSPG